MKKTQYVINLFGPTASGKTALASQLSRYFPSTLISVDSAQIYRHMDIGTAKPDQHFLAEFPHHLIDICEPEESYSVAHFCRQANDYIDQAHRQGKTPILVGGSMLYFHSLYHGLSDLPSADQQLRSDLETEIQSHGLTALYHQLKRIDPEQAAKISPTDKQRIMRMIELFKLTGKAPSELFINQKKPVFNWQPISFALIPERKILHHSIEKRFQEMIDHGFLQEMASLFARPTLSALHPSMRCAGYQQYWQFLEQRITEKEAFDLSIIASRQLAKRQITWINNRIKDILQPTLLNPQEPRLLDHVLSLLQDYLPEIKA